MDVNYDGSGDEHDIMDNARPPVDDQRAQEGAAPWRHLGPAPLPGANIPGGVGPIPPFRGRAGAPLAPPVEITPEQIAAYLTRCRERTAAGGRGAMYDLSPAPPEADLANLAAIIDAADPAINGGYDAIPQGVSVVYMGEDKRLIIPLGLLGTAPPNDIPWIKYAQYVASKWIPTAGGDDAGAWMEGEDTDASTVPIMTYRKAEGLITFSGPVPLTNSDDTSLAMVAALLGFKSRLNYDPRDSLFLNSAEHRAKDGDFNTDVPLSRLRPKLHMYTMIQLGALNMLPCDSRPMAAMSRAYLVSMGFLADNTSQHGIEYSLTTHRGTSQHVHLCSDYIHANADMAIVRALSFGALFGLLHLARHHTYKASDEILMRVAQTYLNAMRTVLDDPLRQEVDGNREVYLRTLAHPFGLGQTLACATWGLAHRRIAEPLGIRVITKPPEVSRLFFVYAALCQMRTLGFDALLAKMYSESLKCIVDGVNMVNEDPTAFSGLAVHYGHAETRVLSEAIKSSIAVTQAMAAGFALAYFVESAGIAGGKRYGLAAAASLASIQRDHGPLVDHMRGIFEAFKEKVTTEDPSDSLARMADITSVLKAAGQR